MKVAVEGKSTRVLEIGNRPGPGGSVRWSIIPCTKGWGFDPQSEHMQKATDQCSLLHQSLSLSLPLSSPSI